MTHYEVLGVIPGASPAEIRAAYRHLARRLHPDSPGSPPDAQVRMARVNEAWAVLSDPDRRSLYDAELVLAARRAADPGPWRPSSTGGVPPRAPAPPPTAPIVQVVGPVFLLLGLLSMAGGFLMLRPPMMVFGLLSVVVGLYAMVATAVISLRGSRRARRRAQRRARRQDRGRARRQDRREEPDGPGR